MFTITTAKGKGFDCDCALAPQDSEYGFVHLLNVDLNTVQLTFENKDELPFDLCPNFTEVALIKEKNDGIEITLKQELEEVST